ncbi:MAG TPA: molybdenum cofactor biosynthesis protein MoaE [Terriglobia bacterium]|nr:molybdenum cofactor biosynthesis protein MoaE [Terriglobia bacterium]
MKIKVLFFGLTHDLTGFDHEQVDLPDGGRLDDLCRRYEVRFPRLREMADSIVTAVNQEIVERSSALRDGDEVAFLPPVSGGAPDAPETAARADVYRITHSAIPTDELARELKAPADGAVVVFEGIVRDNLGGRRTLYLEYEAYQPMALAKMEEIALEARLKFPVDRIGMIHRVGRIEIGETSVAIVVTSAHRRAAFEACHYLIDRLKQVVPIWKKEYFADGAIWAEGESDPRLQAGADLALKVCGSSKVG